jgi:thiamine biosynthesis lipoprotein
MGTVAELKVVSRDAGAAERALDDAIAELQRIERLATVHDSASDVSRINAAAPEGVLVDADTDAVLALSLDVASRSHGAFDPVAGALLRLWGFPEHPAVPDSSALGAALSRIPVDGLARVGDRTWRTIAAGVEIDLGGIAKGYGVDRAADVLERTGSCIVNAGGDLAVRGTRPDGSGWLIGVQDPRNPDQLFLKLRLGSSEAVATSGDYQHYVDVDGVRYHHLLDPRTGWPARGASSATVIAPTCALADASWAAYPPNSCPNRTGVASMRCVRPLLTTSSNSDALARSEVASRSRAGMRSS